MFTFSWPATAHTDAWKQRMVTDCRRRLGSYVRKDQIRPFFEISDKGYEHCHLIAGWSRPSKCASFHKIIRVWQKDAKSPEMSNACHVIPRGDKEAAAIGPYKVMYKYLTDPSKKKTIDENGVSWKYIPGPPRPPDNGSFWWKLEWLLLPKLDEQLKLMKSERYLDKIPIVK